MTFEEDLTKRRIDVAAFAAGDPDKYAEWREMYAQMHPNSFYVSVKMVLNDVRRKFWLAEAAKTVVATTDAPAKPVTRRASIPGGGAAKPEINPIVASPEPESAEPKPTATPGKGRAVIRKAVPVEAEAPDTFESAPLPTDKPAPEEAPKVPRARPVIRRPTPATENSDVAATEKEQIAQDNTNSATPFHANPDPEAETEATPKPPRPRPVFRKPGSASPVEQPAAETPDKSLPAGETVTPIPEQTKPEETKPPRPRPIFKRPVESASVIEANPDTTMPAANNAETKEELPPEKTAPVPAAKPPRLRPVIRKPNPAPESAQPPALPETTPPENESQEESATPSVTEPPKPPRPRPRPIFKRPTKPDEASE